MEVAQRRWVAVLFAALLAFVFFGWQALPVLASDPPADGSGYGWGRNSYGQIGDGSTTDRSEPTAVTMPADVTFSSIDTALWHVCAVGSDTKAYCWGYNSGAGQVGDGTYTNRSAPTQVAAPTGVSFTSVSTGSLHTCGISSSGDGYCWGLGSSGQIGDGGTSIRPTPRKVTMPSSVTFTSITTGNSHSCALSDSGNAYCWGENGNGQLGLGDTVDRNVPTALTMPSSVTFSSMKAGHNHTCARGSDENTYCWGANGSGQLGVGDTSSRTAPTRVSMPVGKKFATISSGLNLTCSVTSAGEGYCWGENNLGQLGINSTADKPTPSAVVMPDGVTFSSIDAGYDHTCAIGSNGSAYCWGSNDFRELGDGTTQGSRRVPTLVVAPEEVSFSAIAAGRDGTVALTGSAPASPVESGSISSGGARYTFHFHASTGGPCLSNVTVVRGQVFELPPSEVACTPEGTTLVGWSIPGQDANFSPGGRVTVWDNQTFTAVAKNPEISIEYDSNVGEDTSCLHEGVDMDLDLRTITVETDRGGQLIGEPHCTPPGHKFVGWTELPTTDGPSQPRQGAGIRAGGGSVPFAWSLVPDPVNRIRLYALWVAAPPAQ